MCFPHFPLQFLNSPSSNLEKKMTPPSPETLQAFGLSGPLTPLAGGRGLCYRINGTVLKPCDDIAESQWLSELSACFLHRSPTAYRISVPLPSLADPNTYVANGWCASSYISGVGILQGSFEGIFAASRALHTDLAELVHSKPEILSHRAFNRFDEADRVTWGEKTLDEVEKVSQEMLAQLQPILDKLRGVMQPLPPTLERGGKDLLAPQLVHMDLLGNVLFEDGKPPGIIDLTFYWRPVAYAEAVVVVDGLTRVGQGRELVESFLSGESGDTTDAHADARPVRVQLLVRALYWRYLTFAIDPDLEWVRVNLPRADYAGAADIVCGLVTRE